MTVIGAWATPDRAFCWADSEIFWRDSETGLVTRSAGHRFKLALNEQASVAAVGFGDLVGNALIAEMVARAHSFDEFCFRLPQHLNEGATEDQRATGIWPDWICAAAGFSSRHRRMMAAVFPATSGFLLAYVAHFEMPHVLPSFAIAGPEDFIPVAKEQFGRLNFAQRSDGRGVLTIAEVRRASMSVSAFDLNGGFELPELPNLPPMISTHPSFAEGSA